uniref:Uncharacterized protein n=1 Tax=Rhizophora mucronata TaxID=61149 RepID=A0A2P2QYY2_RHIMU
MACKVIISPRKMQKEKITIKKEINQVRKIMNRILDCKPPAAFALDLPTFN